MLDPFASAGGLLPDQRGPGAGPPADAHEIEQHMCDLGTTIKGAPWPLAGWPRVTGPLLICKGRQAVIRLNLERTREHVAENWTTWSKFAAMALFLLSFCQVLRLLIGRHVPTQPPAGKAQPDNTRLTRPTHRHSHAASVEWLGIHGPWTMGHGLWPRQCHCILRLFTRPACCFMPRGVLGSRLLGPTAHRRGACAHAANIMPRGGDWPVGWLWRHAHHSR